MSQTAASTLYRTARLFSNMGDKKKIVALLSGGLESAGRQNDAKANRGSGDVL